MTDAQKLAALAEVLCLCVCCGEMMKCDPDCTHADDCPEEHAEMEWARGIIFGEDDK
jgi:hypothetical protein